MKVAIVGTGLQFKRRMSGLDPEKDQLVGVAFFAKSRLSSILRFNAPLRKT